MLAVGLAEPPCFHACTSRMLTLSFHLIRFPNIQGKGTLRRVNDVFDCWFESGSMPYGQLHYPFENKVRLALLCFPGVFYGCCHQ